MCSFVFSVVSSQSHDAGCIMGNAVKGKMGCEASRLQLPICLWPRRVGTTLQYWSKLKEKTLSGEGGKDWWTQDTAFLRVVSGGRQSGHRPEQS